MSEGMNTFSSPALRRATALLSSVSVSSASPLSTSATAGDATFRALVLDSADKGKTVQASVKQIDVRLKKTV
jgi:hypothetical protein